MLQRRPGETLQQLLERLDAAIDTAITTQEMIDEINAPDSKPSRRY
jgi:predicted RNase H-like HicB family nuclease